MMRLQLLCPSPFGTLVIVSSLDEKNARDETSRERNDVKGQRAGLQA